MYSYREIDYNKDLPAIISLLKEGFHKKRILEDFKKKHIDNPFGKSYGLLAFEGDNLIALRMFLRWEFKHNNKLIKAIRPVDTVTHPQHQGKGIFKKINLMGLENCRNEYELIFNTPNKNSFPGYIKMGWIRFPTNQQFKIVFTLPFFSNRTNVTTIDPSKLKIDFPFTNEKLTITNKSVSYFNWRYQDARYKIAKIAVKNKNCFVVYRIEKRMGFNMLILLELIGEASIHRIVLKKLAYFHRCFFIYYLENKLLNYKPLFSFPKNNPVIVYKEDKLNIITDILFSAGDLEGII